MQKFDIKIQDHKGCENQIADHLSRLESETHIVEQGRIREEFPNEQLLALEVTELPWYTDIINFLVSEVFPLDASSQQKKKLVYQARFYV